MDTPYMDRLITLAGLRRPHPGIVLITGALAFKEAERREDADGCAFAIAVVDALVPACWMKDDAPPPST